MEEPSGQVIRVHTGKLSDKHLVAEADRAGRLATGTPTATTLS
jgi:hypothetical protein